MDPEVADLSGEDTASAEAAMLSSSSTQGFGWVWSTLLGAGTVNANGSYSYNSAGGTNTITNTSTGVYSVDFPNLAGAGGNVQVTSYGSGSDRCKVASWGTGALATTLRVHVRCHTAGGAPVNTYFVALSSRENNSYGGAYLWNVSLSYHLGMPSTGRVGGFAWASDPVSSSYTPPAS
jgi:hypothetical protein